MKGLVFVEGQGEVEAVGNLLSRLGADMSLPAIYWKPQRSQKLHLEREIRRVAEIARRTTRVDALLILRDEDDACPRETGPRLAAVLRGAALPFPSAPPDPEAVRGAKEWLRRRMPRGQTYKATLDQLPFTRMLNIRELREAALPCIGTLERALRFLHEGGGVAGRTYPPPIEEA